MYLLHEIFSLLCWLEFITHVNICSIYLDKISICSLLESRHDSLLCLYFPYSSHCVRMCVCVCVQFLVFHILRCEYLMEHFPKTKASRSEYAIKLDSIHCYAYTHMHILYYFFLSWPEIQCCSIQTILNKQKNQFFPLNPIHWFE